jgi:hypothetical protein
VNAYGYERALRALRDHGAVLRVSYGLHTTAHLSWEDGGRYCDSSVRFDSFRRLLDEGRIVERRQYEGQPLSLHVYDARADEARGTGAKGEPR